MSLEKREVDGVLIVHPGYVRVTASSGAQELGRALEAAVKEGRLAIAVDLAGVEYADSTMIGILISTFKSLNQNKGVICLYNVGPELHEFFRQTVLDRLIEVCKDEQTALTLVADRARPRRKGLRRLFS